MGQSRGRAGSHTTLIDAARPVVELLERHGRVSRGTIEGRVGAGGLSIKITSLPSCLRITVVSKGSRQELHAYGITPEQARELLSVLALRGYQMKFLDSEPSR